MNTLFDNGPVKEFAGNAFISDCGKYRYILRRIWDLTLRRVCFIMLNPSTADALVDDPTVRRCLGYARAWDCGSLCVANLYAYRATDPAALFKASDPVGEFNDECIAKACFESDIIVAAWGSHAKPERRDAVLKLLQDKPYIRNRGGIQVLKLTKSGEPGHPLYLKADLKPMAWR